MNRKMVLLVILALILNGMQVNPIEVKAEQYQPITLDQGITVNKVNFEVVNSIDTPQHMKDIIDAYKEKQGFIYCRDDSSGYYYIAIMYGLKPSGGYSINVKSVIDNEGKTYITVEENEPAPGTMVPMMITYPYVVIKVRGITSNITVESTSGTAYTDYSDYVKEINKSQLTDKHWKTFQGHDNVEIDKQWTIKFSKPVIEQYINSLNIYIVDDQGNKAATKLLLSKDRKSAVVVPFFNYDLGKTYYLFIYNNKNSDCSDTAMKGFRMQFTTKNYMYK